MKFWQREIGFVQYHQSLFKLKFYSYLKWDGFFVRKEEINSKEELRKRIIHCAAKSVSIGPCYTTKLRQTFAGKEYTFDLDISDYGYKECCDKKRICERCVIILRTAAKIIEYELQTSFGVKTMYWGNFNHRELAF